MSYYYYPLSTRDFAFENIFSSESVSPAIYYANRAFGFDYFPVLPGVNHDNAIVLFGQPPVYNDENNARFILQIAEAAINRNDLVFLAEGMFAYSGTIYFEKEHLRILFLSPKDLKIAVLRSNSSLPTKATEKYIDSFDVISEAECRAFPAIEAETVKVDDETGLKIALDKRYNHFKGFIYGLVIGQVANDRKKEFGFKVRLQEITNAFAELKSRLEDHGTTKQKSGSSNGLHFYIEKLFMALDVAEKEYHHITFGDTIPEQVLIEYLLDKQTRLKSIQEVTRYLDYVIVTDELLGTNSYQEIINRYIGDSNTAPGNFKELKSYVEQFIHIFQTNAKTRYQADDLNNKIKQLLRNENERYREQLSQRTYNLTTDLNGISYDFIANEVSLDTRQPYLNTKSDGEFTFIINAILKFAKANKGPAQKEAILNIVEEIGNSYNKRGRNTLLYQYLENKIDVYSLDNASNLVMKNFVAFIFNPDSLEKLDNFLISKKVEERWMAFSFWGAYNGFANISRNYTRDIFSPNNTELQNKIDRYLRDYLLTVRDKKPKIINVKQPNQIPSPESSTPENSEPESVIKFFNLHVANQYQLNIDEFTRALTLTNQKDFQEELKLKHQIAKKDSLKLFTAIKKYFDPSVLFH